MSECVRGHTTSPETDIGLDLVSVSWYSGDVQSIEFHYSGVSGLCLRMSDIQLVSEYEASYSLDLSKHQ